MHRFVELLREDLVDSLRTGFPGGSQVCLYLVGGEGTACFVKRELFGACLCVLRNFPEDLGRRREELEAVVVGHREVH